MAPHSSTLAWKIPWMEEPGRLQSMGSLRVGHDWATSLSLFTFLHWRRKWQPTSVLLPGESLGQRSLVGYSPWVHRVGHNWATDTRTHTHTGMRTVCGPLIISSQVFLLFSLLNYFFASLKRSEIIETELWCIQGHSWTLPLRRQKNAPFVQILRTLSIITF